MLSFLQSAVKQATAANQKHKNDYLTRALKCYALAMSGKKDEANLVRGVVMPTRYCTCHSIHAPSRCMYMIDLAIIQLT